MHNPQFCVSGKRPIVHGVESTENLNLLDLIFQITLGTGYDLGVNQTLSVSGDGSNIITLSLSTKGVNNLGGVRSVDWNIVNGLSHDPGWSTKRITLNK